MQVSAGLRSSLCVPRRELLAAAGGALALTCLPASAITTVTFAGIVRQWAGITPVQEGRVELEIAPLVENGNTVPITVRLFSPMTPADHVQEIVVYNERNPQREVVRFTFGPASAKAEASTRIRLATSQQLVALARLSDGSQWANYVNVIVTLAACVEG